MLLAVGVYLMVSQIFLDFQGLSFLGCANTMDLGSLPACVPCLDFQLKEILNFVKYYRMMFWARLAI